MTGFTLLDATTDQPIATFSTGATIDLRTLPTRMLDVRAETAGVVASVRFGLDGQPAVRIDSTAGDGGFTLDDGEDGEDGEGWTPSVGALALAAVPFTGAGGAADTGLPMAVNFEVIDEPTGDSAALGVSADSLDFGTVAPGQAATRGLTLTNRGDAADGPLVIDATALGGTTGVFSDDFDDAGAVTLRPGQSTTLTITFTPGPTAVAGAAAGTLAVVHSGELSPARISLGGTVQDPAPVADQVHLSWTANPAATMTVVWRTPGETAGPSVVQYRPAGATEWLTAAGSLRPSGTEDGTLREATITGLSPDTAYEYRAGGGGAGETFGAVYSFETAPFPAQGDFDFLYFADTGIAGRPDGLTTGTLGSIEAMAGLGADFVLPGGDYTYYNTDNERFGSYDAAIDAWFAQMQPLLAAAPAMPTYGNHEERLDGGLDEWLERFAVPADNTTDNGASYSFDVAGVHFVSTLAGHRDTDPLPQARVGWIRQDIEAAGRPARG